MTDLSPPDIGQPNWGLELNAYLIATETRTMLNDARIDALELRLSSLEAQSNRVYSSAQWTFNSALPPAVTVGNQSQVRFDNSDYQQVTLIDFRTIDNDGADRKGWFQMLDAGSIIRIHDWDDSSVFQRFEVTGPVTFPDATNVHVSVTWGAGNGVLPSAKANVGFLAELKI